MTGVRSLLIGSLAILVFAATATVSRAHRPVTSTFTYNEHIHPLFVERCGSCHAEGGVAPMSLLTYRAAFPWAQSIKEEVVGLRMPPGQAEHGYSRVRDGYGLTARELDMIVDWANGGTPEGPDAQAEDAAMETAGPLGEPAVSLPLPGPYTLDADTDRATRYFVVATGLAEDRWVSAADFLADNRAIVRSAVVWVDPSGRARTLDEADPVPGFAADAGDPGFPTDRVLLTWRPGAIPVTLDAGLGFRLPAGADLVVLVRYGKTWLTEGSVQTDRSSVGLYFSEAAGTRGIDTLAVTATDGSDVSSGTRQARLVHTFVQETDLLALLPESVDPLEAVRVDSVQPDGRRQPILLVSRFDPSWPMRYWLESPVRVAAGGRIELTATVVPQRRAAPGRVPSSGHVVPDGRGGDVRLRVNVVPVAPQGDRE